MSPVSSLLCVALCIVGVGLRRSCRRRRGPQSKLTPLCRQGAVDTAGVAEAVLQWLTDNKIHHTVFARTVLGWNTAFTPLLRKPVPWAEADQRTRKAYHEMLAWLQRPHQERLDTVREKQDQMNRKRRTESSQKDQRRRRPDAAPAPPPPLGAAGLPGEPLPGFELAVAGHGFPGDAAVAPGGLPAGFSEDEFSQPELAAGQQYTALAGGGGGGAAVVAPPSYQDSVVQQQQQLAGYQERPPPLYNAPLPGYEELSRGYGGAPAGPPPPPAGPQVGQELTFAHLTPTDPQPQSQPVQTVQPQIQPQVQTVQTVQTVQQVQQQVQTVQQVQQVQQPPPGEQQEPLSPPELLQPPDGRPLRAQISPLQRRALIDIFHVTARPSSAMRQLIASTLDLPQRTITNFFSAARTRGIRKQMAHAAHGKEQPMVDARP